ncbi:hypothetical protein SDC9_32714 [bioreactor metagenome]|uniref:TM2 domain-containing protein n=1 Tax=bioreactor metagenome TaxID=1076179 RepID=A0A644V5V8_9ZZZZ|nr:hypothetical protein [Methanocorpusculum sp.]
MANENGLPTTSFGRVVTGKKSMILGLILWFFLGGIGLVYAGRVGLGIALFIIQIICAFIAFLIIPAIIAILVWIAVLVLTYNAIKENNELWARHQTY